MTRAKRMEPVAELADKKAGKAASALAEKQRQAEEQAQRLEQLESFRNEYSNRLKASLEFGMDAFRLRDYRAFIARIDGAIEQQRQAVQRSEGLAEQKREEWLRAWSRSRALNNVVENAREEEQREQDRREQHESDELALHRIPPQDDEG